MALTIKKADGKQYKVAGYKFSQVKLGGAKVAATKYNNSQLPQKVDLRNYMTNIEQQGGLNSCVANAVAGAYEYLAKRHKGVDYDVSRVFIYYNARYMSDMQNEDEGAYIADAIQSLKEYGACSEETYPYREGRVNEEPAQEAYDEAAGFLVESSERVENNLESWKSMLAEGYPIIFGLLLFDSFDNHRKKGLVPHPSDSEQSRESHSGHAMLCVGYSDPDQVFIVRNSWGNDWGDKGYCYIPYRYLINEKFNMGDSWIIKQLDHFEDNKEEYWSDEEESILSTIESEIANMSDEDYQAMCDEMGDVPLEQRLALILLTAAEADEDFSDDEYAEIAGYLDDILYQIGIECDVEELLRNSTELVGDEDLLVETVDLLNNYLSKSTLAQTILDVESIIGVDDLAEEEESFVNELIDAWQIEDTHFQEIADQNETSEEEEGEEESEDDENGDYEEEEEEYSEEEEEEEYSDEDENGDYEEEDDEYYDEEEDNKKR